MEFAQPLFDNFKQRLFFALFLLGVFICTLSFKFYQFHTLKSQKTPQLTAQVLLQYTKTNQKGDYFVLKLKSDFGVFYTTSREDLRDIKYRFISLRIITDRLTFLDFLRGFYVPSFNLTLLPQRDFREHLRNFILAQHNTSLMGEYYLALFLSDGLPKEWRVLAQHYGISHIFAISGFHTGILSAVGFFILGFLYKPLHKRFFPFRNFFFDVGIATLAMLIGYYFLLTQSFSYLRAITMSLVVFLLFWRGLRIWNLETLFWCVGILISFFPILIFSLGFHLSWLGVLYIFLFFKFCKIPKGFFKKFLYGFLLNASTFFLTGSVAYYFFPFFSPLALCSLILTPLFTLYYPFILLMHLFCLGGILDPILLLWVGAKTESITLPTNFYWLLLWGLLTFFAIYFRWAFFLLLTLGCAFFAYGLYLYF